jgi:hypothetical protein
VVRQASNDCAANKFGRWLPDCNHSADDFIGEQQSNDRPASVADIVVEELRKKEINGPIRLQKRDFFTRGQKLKVKDPGTFSPATIWNSPACRRVSVCA